MRRIAVLSVPLMVSACVAPHKAPPPAAPLPAPSFTPAPAPPPPADWRDRDYTPGDWTYARAGGESEARYGTPDAPRRLTLTCSPGADRIRLGWLGGAAGPVTIRTTYGDVARQAQASGPEAQIIFGARDPLLDQIAYSRGRFMLIAGSQVLVVPAWPEVVRVIEDCR